jgi:hypothetical protein
MICGLIGVVALLLAAVTLGSLVWAFAVWGGIALYNRLADHPATRVPHASLSKCYQVSFMTGLVQVFVGFFLQTSTFIAGTLAGAHPVEALLLAQLMGLPLGVLTMAAMLSALLPTSFGRGILVSLCVTVINVIVVCIALAITIAVMALNAS